MANILDMGGGVSVLDMGDPEERKKKKKLSKTDAMWYAAGLGFQDTIRGVQQIAGYNEEKMQGEQVKLKELEDEYGTGVTMAYWGGLIADPVGWFLPVSRLKYLKHGAGIANKAYNLMIPGAIGGTAAGALGYVDPELGFSRGEQAALGAAGGAALGPVAAGIGKGISAGYKPVGEAIWKGMSTRLDASGAAAGGLAGYNVDSKAPIQDKMANALIGATIGAGVGFGASKAMTRGQKDALGRFFVPDYGLADNYIARRNRFSGDRAAIGGEFDILVREVAGLKEPQRKALYKMLTDKTATIDEGLVGLQGKSRALVKKYGEELRDMGLIDKDTFEKNAKTYLHRTYTRHEGDKFASTEQKIQTIGDELKMRGLARRISKEDFRMGKYPDNRGHWEIIKEGDDWVRVRRDWTPEERARMGEVTDAAYAIDRTGKLLANDVSAFRFFKDLAEDPTIASVNQMGRFSREITGKEFGPALKNMFVSEEVYRDLMGIRKLNLLGKYKRSSLGRTYRGLNSMWKGSKTILNPAVHMNNILSNVHMYDFADGGMADVARAARDMLSKTDEFKEAQNLGVFGGFFADELGNDARAMLNLYSRHGSGATDEATEFIPSAGKIAKDSFNLAKKYSWDLAAKVYTMEDQVFRMALFRSHKADLIRANPKMDPATAASQAAKKAREWFVDYERTSPMLELLREGPLPFISYMYGIVPRLAETAAKKPAKLAKWGLIWHGVNAVGEDMSDKSPEEIAQQRALMSQEKNRGLFGVPGMPSPMIKMPDALTDKNKDDMYMDIGRIIPGGDIYSRGEGGLGQIPYLPQSLQPGFGAAGAVGYPLLGMDAFMGREVPKGEKMDQIIKNFTPNWPIKGFPSFAGKKLERAYSGKYSPTKDVYDPLSARLSGVGIKTTPVSTRKLRKRAGYSFTRDIRNLQTRKRKLRSELKAGGITSTEYAKKVSQINRDIRELRNEKRREQAGLPGKSWVSEMVKKYENIF